MKHHRYALFAVILGTPGFLFGADDDIQSLKKQIQALDQKVRILESKEQQQRQRDEIRTKEAPRLTAGSEGFSFSSADTNFVLRLRGNVQADARFYVDDRIPANDTFLLRRVRPTFEGTVFKHYDYRVMLDFGSGTSISSGNIGFLWDAYLNAHYWPEFQIQVGKFKPPVGLERLQSDVNLLFGAWGCNCMANCSAGHLIMRQACSMECRMAAAVIRTWAATITKTSWRGCLRSRSRKTGSLRCKGGG